MLYYSYIISTNFLSFIVATDPVTPISKLRLFFSGNIYYIVIYNFIYLMNKRLLLSEVG